MSSGRSIAERFVRFYSEFHRDDEGIERPYQWQRRMVETLADGKPPTELIAPTGAGKTTLIECFVFALSEQLGLGDRKLPLRLFWVIDRRAVVDQVFEDARTLAECLRNAHPGSEAHRVAENLRRAGVSDTSDDREPLEVRLWRGGTQRGVEPVPLAAPSVVCSTVDQVGSRLLFRGYGTSFKSRPIDAALVGTDSLVVLDEAHLAQPFAETVGAARNAQSGADRSSVRALRLMRVSATPAEHKAREEKFELTQEELAEQPLIKRLRATKPAQLVELKRTQSLAQGLARTATSLGADKPRVIGVVANMVQDARDAYEELRGERDADAVLLIGPSRPIDRETVLAQIPERSEREEMERPLYVVGTQTLEVGLDLDFDALVSVCAPFPSLVQRFGRLDRAGYVTSERGSAPGAIVRSPEGCPIYRDSAEETWAWLQDREKDGEVNFGFAHLDRYRISDTPPPPAPRGPEAPILGPWHLEALVQTSRDPLPSPEVGFFLHGDEGARDADVSIVWRCDITRSNRDEWEERIHARPPHRGEMLSLPVARVRRWLRSRSSDARFSDIESGASEASSESPPGRPIEFCRIDPPDPDDEWGVSEVEIDQVRPGNVLLVPSAEGGCDEFGWVPGARDAVDDLGDFNSERPHILLGPYATAMGSVPKGIERQVEDVVAELLAETITPKEAYSRLVPDVADWPRTLDRYRGIREAVIEQLESGAGEAALLPDDEPDSLVLSPRMRRRSTTTFKRQRYGDHVERVEALTVAYARSQELDDALIETLRLAARYHDVGKLDPRFQAWLNRGEPPEPGKLLAKSDYSPVSRRSESFRIAAGWPRAKPHEIVSALMVRRAFEAGAFADRDGGIDLDLLLYLPPIHHGQMRPFLPMRKRDGHLVSREEPDSDPVVVTAEVEGESVSVRSDEEVDFLEHAERFLELNERFGPWGLAALEATLVLADRVASAEAA